MENVEQIDEKFNTKKPRKRKLIILAAIIAIIVIALLLVYFLIFSKPEFIFNSAIDKLLKFEEQEYDSVKIDTELKLKIEAEDTSLQEQLSEIEKFSLKMGIQMDTSEKKEIVDFGLEYDNESVIDVQAYSDNENQYVYLNEIFDKYIKVSDDGEGQVELDFLSINSDNKDADKKIIEIIKKELKNGIKERGEFKKEKTTIEIGDDDKKVTKSTLILSQKALYNFISNMCLNLAENDEFLESFEETPEELLRNMAKEIKDQDTNSKSNLKISIYTEGILNKFVGFDVVVYSEEESLTATMSAIKQDENTYSYNVSMKNILEKMDLISGEIKIEQDDKGEKEKTVITAKIAEFGEITLELDSSIEYNKGIDKIEVSNSIGITEITEQDIQKMIENLEKRPIIGDLINNLISTNNITNEMNKELTTLQNEVKNENYGYLVSYSLPENCEYDEMYSYDYQKIYTLSINENDIDVVVNLEYSTEDEYNRIEEAYDFYLSYFKNIDISEETLLTVEDKEFKYRKLTGEYDTDNDDEKFQKLYVWYRLDDEHLFAIEATASTNEEITEDILKEFLNINVEKLN